MTHVPPHAPVPATLSPPRPRRKFPVLGAILAALLVIALGVLAFFVVTQLQTQQRLDEAETLIEQQQRDLDERDETIREQQEAVDSKETFAQAMRDFMAAANPLNGLPFGALVPLDQVESEARTAWDVRWTPALVADRTAEVIAVTERLNGVVAAAAANAGQNASGTVGEATLDLLGAGFVESRWSAADEYCGRDVLACVDSSDPYVVHFDLVSDAEPSMNDWIREGLAHHEFAHVLQFTNPGPTETAAAAFGGDWETMADCYALTTLPGWTLEHRVWVSEFSYWDVNVGYGYVCNDAERQVIRDWIAEIGVRMRPISQ